MDPLFSKLTTLQYQNKAMRQELEAFRNGERYRKLQADYCCAPFSMTCSYPG